MNFFCHVCNVYLWLLILSLFQIIVYIFKIIFDHNDDFYRIVLLIFDCFGILIWGLNFGIHYNDTYSFIFQFFNKLFGGI